MGNLSCNVGMTSRRYAMLDNLSATGQIFYYAPPESSIWAIGLSQAKRRASLCIQLIQNRLTKLKAYQLLSILGNELFMYFMVTAYFLCIARGC